MKEVGRNDPCPCGSGRKYKKCCEAKQREPKKISAQLLPSSLDPSAKKIANLFPRPGPSSQESDGNG